MARFDPRPTVVAAILIIGTVTSASASGQYWVVGNLITNSCDIVSQNPVVRPDGPVWFGNGPHKTYDDARMARDGISACPRSN